MRVDQSDDEIELSALSMEQLRELAEKEEQRIATLGNWPSWMEIKGSISSRIPLPNNKKAAGFDAGVASALRLIPIEKQKLSSILHGAYTPEAVEQIRREAAHLDPDSETAWWLAACKICREGADVEVFQDQLSAFDVLRRDEKKRLEAARNEYDSMTKKFETTTYGVPFGTEDGCMQGAYIAGYPFATTYASNYGLYFIGTYLPSLGLEAFPWSSEVDEINRPKSGPVRGSLQFVKCANEAEFRSALEVVKKALGKRADMLVVTPEAVPEGLDTGKISAAVKALLQHGTIEDATDRRLLSEAVAFIETPTENLSDIATHASRIGEVMAGYDMQGSEPPPEVDAMNRHLQILLFQHYIRTATA